MSYINQLAKKINKLFKSTDKTVNERSQSQECASNNKVYLSEATTEAKSPSSHGVDFCCGSCRGE